MTGVEILLLVIGVGFFIASFFIVEKLSPGELNKIGELSNDEIQKVMERELQKVSGEIEGRVEEKVEEALIKSEDTMDQLSKEKILTIHEYADTIIESMNKTHNEIMFLYSMLNDKHAELTQFSAKLQGLASDLEKKDAEISKHLKQEIKPAKLNFGSATKQQIKAQVQRSQPAREPVKEPSLSKMQEMAIQPTKESAKEQVSEERASKKAHTSKGQESLPGEIMAEQKEFNHNSAILALHKEGKTSIEIARELALGLGEVQLVIGLYEGKRKK